MTLAVDELLTIVSYYKQTALGMRQRADWIERVWEEAAEEESRLVATAELESCLFDAGRGLEAWGMWLVALGIREPDKPLVMTVRAVRPRASRDALLSVLDEATDLAALLRVPRSDAVRTSLGVYGADARAGAEDRVLQGDNWDGLRVSLGELAQFLSSLDHDELTVPGFIDVYNCFKHGAVGGREIDPEDGRCATQLLRDDDGVSWYLKWPDSSQRVRELCRNAAEVWDRLANFVSLLALMRRLGLLDPAR